MCSAASWHNKRLLLYNMINLSSISVKLTQFCKEIKQIKLTTKSAVNNVKRILSRLSLLGATHLSMGKKPKKIHSSIKPIKTKKNPLGWAFKKTGFVNPVMCTLMLFTVK